jgi:hypothetical protein
MTLVEFEVQEELLARLEKDAKERRGRAARLRQEAQQLDKDAEDTLKVRSEYLEEFVTAELVRRNLSCCGCCGKVTNEVAVCSIYESASPTRLTIWRLCSACQKAKAWEFAPDVLSSGTDVPASKLYRLSQARWLHWKNLSPISAREAFRQLKELAAQEDTTRNVIPRYQIND